MRNFILPFVFFSLINPAQADSFRTVLEGKLTGLRFESPEQIKKLREDASAYAHFRRYRESTRAKDLLASCFEDRVVNSFCDLITEVRGKSVEVSTSKETRNKFVQTLLSLDLEPARAKNCPKAFKALSEIAADEAAASLHIRANYWMWVCANVTAQTEEAAKIAAHMNQKYPVSHHTLLILQKDNPARLAEIFADGQDWPVQFRSEAKPEINVWIAGIESLMEQNEDGAAAVLGVYVNPLLQDAEPEVRLYMAILMSRVSASIPSTLPVARVMVPLFQNHPEYVAPPVLRLLFPDDYQMGGADPKKRYVFRDLVNEHKADLDASLLKGLIHQESALNPRAASSAGAFGLTQMLTGTATDIWKKISGDAQAQVTGEMLREPSFSVKLGAADLKRRLQNFGGNVNLAVASYNAGETGVKTWLKEVKPIRDPQIQTDLLFMNRAPESHVPQYVSAVLSKAFWYSRLYPQ